MSSQSVVGPSGDALICTECGAKNQKEAKFCAACGVHPVSKPLCPSCGTENRLGARFCAICGTPMRDPACPEGRAEAADYALEAKEPATYHFARGRKKAAAINTKCRGIVKKGVLASIAAGPLGAIAGPFDAGAICGIWSTMFIAIAKQSGQEIDGTFVKRFISTVGTGAATYYGGCKAATVIFHAIPGAGTLAAIGASTAMNALFTYKFGAAVSNLFDKSDFDINDALNAARKVLSLMCTRPSLSEVQGLLSITDAVV